MSANFTFTATAPNGAGMSTNYIECIPWDSLDSMTQCGVTFRVNSKKLTAKQLRDMYYGKSTQEFIAELNKTYGHTAEAVQAMAKVTAAVPANFVRKNAAGAVTEIEIPEGCPYTKEQIRGNFTKFGKEVICQDTNEVFMNQSEAAKYFGIDPAQVSDSIKTGRPRSGHVFKKVIW